VTRRTSTRLGAWTACLLLAASATSALAEGDPADGKEIAYTCMGCHGIDGYRNAYPSYRVPKLGGQRASYIENALKAYRSGSRPHPTMRAQGSSLSDQDIADVAAWFENGESVEVTVSGDEPGYPDVGQTCLACHGQGGAAVQPTPPVLSGQHESYIVHALNQYKTGARGGNVMNAFAGTLSDDDIAALAAFYSSRSGLYTPEKSQ
jgi:cytochrome c553